MAGPWQAFPLISAAYQDSSVTLHILSNAREALLSLCTTNIGVLGVFGPPASEKQLLLCTLLQSHDVDTRAGRKDVLLWLWIRQDQEQHHDDKSRVVLVAGSSLEADNEQEIGNPTLALLLLLSSALLYNTEGEINTETVEKLQWVEHVSHVLRVKEMQDDDAVGEIIFFYCIYTTSASLVISWLLLLIDYYVHVLCS